MKLFVGRDRRRRSVRMRLRGACIVILYLAFGGLGYRGTCLVDRACGAIL